MTKEIKKRIEIIDMSDEEKQAFRDAMSHVKPLKSSLQFSEKPKEKRKKFTPRVQDELEITHEKSLLDFDDDQPLVSGDDAVSFSKAGLQRKQMLKLKQGKLSIEATLDLHHCTSEEAIEKTNLFLIRCQNRGLKSVCIIHGKGHFSDDHHPILKNALNNYLRGHHCVLAFHSAKNKQGGTGAMIVMIKAK